MPRPGLAFFVLAGGALLLTIAAAPSPPAIRFREAAAAGGLVFRLANHPTPQKHLPETVAGGLAIFDYDGDGRPDVFFTNGAALPSLEKESPQDWNRLFHNEGGMRFTDVTERAGVRGRGYSMGAAAGDYDNDGHVDLFVAGVNRNVLYRNRGDGTFEDVTERAGIKSAVWSVAAGWFDYDGDGRLDLFVVNYVQWSPAFDRFCGDPVRKLRVYCHPRYFEGLPNTLYRNRGDGTFEDVSERSGIARHVGKGMSVAFADYDEDGRVDAYVTNDGVPNFLFRNRGDGTFEETALRAGAALPDRGAPVSSMGADFRDYDNDGRPDVATTALAGETFPLFHNEGKGQFRDATAPTGLGALTARLSGWGVVLADLDNDGWKDLFTANAHVNDQIESFEAARYRLSNAVFANRGDGTFADASDASGVGSRPPGAHRGVAVADLDGDGRLDVVTSALGEPAELWVNETGGGSGWLRVELVGTRSNRDGIGAVVRVGAQANEMTTAVGYASSSHAGVHFGLGRAERVDVEVAWPSGLRQRAAGVSANQVLRLTEPGDGTSDRTLILKGPAAH
ncbi:MAG TPA: CRTAC1 family protein [Gemmatimonadales bacterium]|nr:CRTAC1 family protein [Gemmatimonadales bacterium]